MEKEINTLALRADYKIENSPCSCLDEELDIWDDFKEDRLFVFCPFCGKPIMRTIFIPIEKYIGGTVILKK